MPDNKKPSDKKDLPVDQVRDAVIVDDQTGSDTVPASEDVTADKQDTPQDLSETATDKSETESIADQDMRPVDEPAEPVQDTGPAPEDAALASQPPMSDPKPEPQPVVVRKGGFVPMVLGGVVAAVIGIAIAQSGALDNILPASSGAQQAEVQQALTGLGEQIAAQEDDMTDLSDRLAALESAPVPESDEIPDLTPMLDDLSSRLDEFETRLAEIEERPTGSVTSTGPDTATAENLEETRAELDNLRQLIDTQQADIAAVRDGALREEEAAQLSAERALQRAALARIQTALDTGTDFDEAVTDLRDAELEIPQSLADRAETGVATLSSLQASFPDLARDALRIARQDQGTTGLNAFLQTQLGVRSLSAREGNDPDAVLSRAEAALQQGLLPETLSELDTLPEAAKAVFSDWQAQAEARLAALAAAQDLSQSLNTN